MAVQLRTYRFERKSWNGNLEEIYLQSSWFDWIKRKYETNWLDETRSVQSYRLNWYCDIGNVPRFGLLAKLSSESREFWKFRFNLFGETEDNEGIGPVESIGSKLKSGWNSDKICLRKLKTVIWVKSNGYRNWDEMCLEAVENDEWFGPVDSTGSK